MSIISRLYRGETRFEFIGTRKRWYLASLVLVVLCVLSISLRGFNYGVDFQGGTTLQIPISGTSITTAKVDTAVRDAGLTAAEAAQQVGSGGASQIRVKTDKLGPDKQQAAVAKIASDLGLSSPGDITVNSVGSSWGHDVTVKAIEGLIVFLIVVSIYISFRFAWRMAVGGIVALLHDLLVAAGIYSIIGFEVTPSTVVGLLTILGFSLYDTVVVYDKVAENSRNLLAGARMTYADAANLAVNQTLMRSINTSLIALLPVAGLLFVGAGILGVGTIKDLALILFVGLASGAYSSLFLATPIVVDLTESAPEYQALRRRVTARRSNEAKREEQERDLAASGIASARPPKRAGGPAPAPRPGARREDRPQRRRR